MAACRPDAGSAQPCPLAQFKEWLRGALRKERARAEFDARLALYPGSANCR
ncbi:MAG TPA: hypothetical protein VK939_06595 [Longimicrobiales bacterium]|nr:hypothetical protein [Longimicrobiales bacterium]